MNYRLFIKKIFLFILLLFLAIEVKGQTGFKNPVIPGYYPDPSICRVGNDYYLVNSTFEYFPGVPVFHSKDLIHWQQIGNCLNRESQINLHKLRYSLGVFAPTIRYYDGVFYMVTTAVGSGGNFYVTTTDPAGEWSDPIWVAQPGIDPTIFRDEDGKTYFISTGEQMEGMILSEIDITTGELLSKPVAIWGGTGGRYPEGPHIYKRNGYYYLLISEGGTEYAHSITIARSKNIWGPYESNPANPILTHCSERAQNNPIQGTGHADLIEAHDGSWWMVFLGFRPQIETHHLLGRETFLTPVEWSEDGWPVINGGQPVTPEMTTRTLPLHPWSEKEKRINFDIPVLGMEWIYLRNPILTNYSLIERKGFLRLKGSNISLNENDTPTFVGRRQQHFSFDAITPMEYNLQNEGDEAGITIYMNPFSHYDLYVTHKEEKNILTLRYQLGKITHIANETEIKGNVPVYLKVSGYPDNYQFFYSENGETFNPLGEADTRYLSTETAGGFTGIVLGLYSYSTHSSSPTLADFKWFEYEGLE